jgi:hypothetical protein
MKCFCSTFTPAFTPHQMLRLGVFEGRYLNSTLHEYPASWRRGAKLSDISDPTINAFGVKSRQPLSIWLENGWIHPQDPWGWFQWYCRYYTGRRTDDDARQIARWRAFARHSAQVVYNGNRDVNTRRVQRQALLQWSWDPLPDFKNIRGESAWDKFQSVMHNK